MFHTNAEYQEMIRENIANGMSEKEAVEKAYADMFEILNECGENWY